MSRRSLSQFLALALAFAVVPACSSDDAAEKGGEAPISGSIVPPGKADNYFSSNAQEYTVTGTTFAIVEQEALLSLNHAGSDRPARSRLITLKNFSIAWFLNQYVIAKHDAANQDWGGFTAMTRPESYEALEISEPDQDGKFSYRFTSELSGPLDLLKQDPDPSLRRRQMLQPRRAGASELDPESAHDG